jgi:peptide/nickel transport system permease protein
MNLAFILLRIAAARFIVAIPLFCIVVAFTFFLIRLAPGDPAYILAGDAPTQEMLASIRAEYGLDGTATQQFAAFLSKALTGDFGTSIFYQKPVFEVILERVPATLLLTLTAVAIATIGGVLMAAYAAVRPGSHRDGIISSLSVAGYSLPTFWIGQILILVFVVQLRWLPLGGMTSPRYNYTGVQHVLDVATHMILPVATLAILLLTMVARFTRTSIIEEMQKDYVTVARAKGASERRVLWAHAFRVAATTTVTVIALELSFVIGGAVLVETIFSWPGLGRLFYEAISKRDFPLLTGAFIFTAAAVLVVNAVCDMVCAALDPRVSR